MGARLIPRIERASLVSGLDGKMAGKKSVPTAESLARAKRQRLAAEEGARAMADIEQKAVAVRKNMERLRALREAREVEEVSSHAGLPAAAKKKRKNELPG